MIELRLLQVSQKPQRLRNRVSQNRLKLYKRLIILEYVGRHLTVLSYFRLHLFFILLIKFTFFLLNNMQHAAHERVNLDFYLEQLKTNRKEIIHEEKVSIKCIISAFQMQTVKRCKSLLIFWNYEVSTQDTNTILITVIL